MHLGWRARTCLYAKKGRHAGDGAGMPPLLPSITQHHSITVHSTHPTLFVLVNPCTRFSCRFLLPIHYLFPRSHTTPHVHSTHTSHTSHTSHIRPTYAPPYAPLYVPLYVQILEQTKKFAERFDFCNKRATELQVRADGERRGRQGRPGGKGG